MLDLLPDDVVAATLSRLSAADVARAGCTCSRLRRVVAQCSGAWTRALPELMPPRSEWHRRVVIRGPEPEDVERLRHFRGANLSLTQLASYLAEPFVECEHSGCGNIGSIICACPRRHTRATARGTAQVAAATTVVLPWSRFCTQHCRRCRFAGADASSACVHITNRYVALTTPPLGKSRRARMFACFHPRKIGGASPVPARRSRRLSATVPFRARLRCRERSTPPLPTEPSSSEARSCTGVGK
mmetsp:Transcript_15439/g.50756  ORF Transcript_15439/g.50756 Transcript_15439/m.50756 type:complete len:244 (+) Transcript_15439:56-787(+)